MGDSYRQSCVQVDNPPVAAVKYAQMRCFR